MKNTLKLTFIAALLLAVSCTCRDENLWLKNAIDTSVSQLLSQAGELEGTGEMPRSIWVGYDLDFLGWQLDQDPVIFRDSLRKQCAPELLGKLRTCDIYNWTSGFFPGSLWYAYELTGNKELLPYAKDYTNILFPISSYTETHDLGFMIECSYGNALRLSPADTIKSVIVNTADNLCSRFDSNIGAIRSWDFGPWNFPVIIDNMMNLDLLFEANRLTGDNKYLDVARRHADKTMANHFREDHTSWHVVSYNNDGTVQCRQTFQGKNDDSAWARGQAWGVYGYTACYRQFKDEKYLNFACAIADMIMSRVTTQDGVPYWDYDAPASDKTPRDASAAAVTACALFELGGFVQDGQKYYDYAEKLLRSLAGPDYLAEPGTNCGFVLKHSVGSLHHGSEIDTPLNYADYYFLEAIKRYMALKGLTYKTL